MEEMETKLERLTACIKWTKDVEKGTVKGSTPKAKESTPNTKEKLDDLRQSAVEGRERKRAAAAAAGSQTPVEMEGLKTMLREQQKKIEALERREKEREGKKRRAPPAEESPREVDEGQDKNGDPPVPAVAAAPPAPADPPASPDPRSPSPEPSRREGDEESEKEESEEEEDGSDVEALLKGEGEEGAEEPPPKPTGSWMMSAFGFGAKRKHGKQD